MSGLLPYGSELLVELSNGKRNVAFSTQCHSKNNSAPQIIWQELEGNAECHTFRLSIWQATSNFFGHLPNRRLWYWMLTASTGFVAIGQRAGSWGLTIDADVCMDTCSGGAHGYGSIMLVDLVQLLFRSSCLWDFLWVAPRRHSLAANSQCLWLLQSLCPFFHNDPWTMLTWKRLGEI